MEITDPTGIERDWTINAMANGTPSAWTPGSAPVAVIMIALNEAHNMVSVLENLKGWAQEVFLVDSFSSDETVDIALRYGVHVVQREFRGFGDQWNFALDELPITSPWTMKLDPDERITEELKSEIVRRLKLEEADGYQCPLRLFFMDRPLTVELRMTRLWRTGTAVFSDVEANEHAKVEGVVLQLKGDIEHRDSPDLYHWWDKQNKYTTAEAIAAHRNATLADDPRLFGSPLQRRMWLKKHFTKFPFRYVALFIYHYFGLGAWRAGWVGYAWSRLRCDVYRLLEYKLREMQMTGRVPLKRPQGHGAPDPRVAQYSSQDSKEARQRHEGQPGRRNGLPNKPTILVFTRHYLPGYLAGGPIRTIANMVARLSETFDFRIVTLDRDHGSVQPYPEAHPRKWVGKGDALVRYVSPKLLDLAHVAEIIRSTPHDAIYLNSFFDYHFTQQILINRKLGRLPERPIVLAPRGEFSEGALRFKYAKKKPFIRIAKVMGLYDRLIWQASSSLEADDIQQIMSIAPYVGSSGDIPGRISIAADLTDPGRGDAIPATEPPRRRLCARLRICFLSRITPMKNLDYALRVLLQVRSPVSFTIYGPIEDGAYWSACEAIIRELPPNIEVRYEGAVSQDQIFSSLRQHDLFFFPTHGENFGHVIHEALGSGLPLLISDQTPWQALEKQGVGWALPLNEPSGFVERIEEVARWSDGETQAASKRARDFAQAVGQDPATLEANRSLFIEAIRGRLPDGSEAKTEGSIGV